MGCHFIPSQYTPQYFPSMRPFHRNSWSPPMRRATREEGGGRLHAHGEPCRRFHHRSPRPLYGLKARVTVLSPHSS